MELIVVLSVAFSAVCGGWLYYHCVMRVCNCYCGPGECQCECACRDDCPCFYRDRFAHNEMQHANYIANHLD